MASTKDRDSSNLNPFGIGEALFSMFMEMKAMVEEMYEDQKKAKGTSGKGKGKPHNFEKQSKGKEEEKPTCSHCKKKVQEDETCWKLHLERLIKKFKDKGKQKATTIVQDLGSDSKVIAMSVKGIFFFVSSSSHLRQRLM
jgi:hypothetical protein